MSNGKKDFYSLADMTRDFEKDAKEASWDKSYWMTAAMIAQAQQLAVISSHLADIAACLETIAGRARKDVQGK